MRSFPCRNGPWELGWRAILNIAIEILSFFVKTVISMDFLLVDFFGTGKYADTSSNNCVSGVLTRVFSMCFPGFDLK